MRPVNFRDVGATVNRLTGTLTLPVECFYRSGRLTEIESPEEVGFPATIINLRESRDDNSRLASRCVHLPYPDRDATYDTRNRDTRKWLKRIIEIVANDGTEFPILIHCTSGKDRTGVAIAAILTIANLNSHVVEREYLESEGVINGVGIRAAVAGMSEPSAYFGVELVKKLRAKLARSWQLQPGRVRTVHHSE